jgi:hypothetical protein
MANGVRKRVDVLPRFPRLVGFQTHRELSIRAQDIHSGHCLEPYVRNLDVPITEKIRDVYEVRGGIRTRLEDC